MRLGILIPTRGVVMQSARRPPVEECWAMAREADAAGFDAIWVGDSVVAKPRLEAMTTLAYLAAITERVRLGTAVLLPALRQPVILAQLIANVDYISQGRLVLGLGVGWSLPSAELEWAACGMDHRRRARLLEEQISVWRALWSGEPVTARGSRLHADRAHHRAAALEPARGRRSGSRPAIVASSSRPSWSGSAGSATAS